MIGRTALALLLAATPALALEKGDTITGTVERVHDGDGPIINGAMVRLWGIDTPELKQEPREHGKAAKETLEALALGKTVSCKVRAIDRYDRPVGRCFDGDMDINAEMVRSGYAWNNWEYARDYYAEEEEEAVCARRGIWAAGILPPWHWRACGR